jgi:acetyl/propionyl-CoA carboxylase alpha subunit
VYSEADAGALHVRLADRAVAIGPAPAIDSYLSVSRLIDAARATEAEAIHPGYGFLSESASLAQACIEAGLVFIGPPAHVIVQMGSKTAARQLVASHGVPVVPGEAPDDQSDAALAAATARIGYPVLLKPSAGGGGIGMHIVGDPGQLAASADRARREARAAFGDDTLYAERLLERPRHIEFQVLADAHGRTLHLFERECSLQRRHQKVIEESPSTALSADLRRRMGEAAVSAARAVGYRNAGTIEFLLEGTGDSARFYFLEMNTRLQVEHPVTEARTGIDLVQAQLRIAAGGDLGVNQEDVTARGHAIECRVYAEDPVCDFLPQAGRILLYREPSGPGIRVDSGIAENVEVPVHYDPLLAKVVAHGASRELARAKAREALRRFVILGIRTNIPFLLRVLEHPAFIRGDVDTQFLDRSTAAILDGLSLVPAPNAAMAAVAMADRARLGIPGPFGPGASAAGEHDPWRALGPWRTGA